jgi:hypothetical protein
MTPFRIALLTCKVLAARWLRIRFELSDAELDALLQACADDPALRSVLEDVLAARR